MNIKNYVQNSCKLTVILTLMITGITSVYGADITSPITASGTYTEPTAVTITGSAATATYGINVSGSTKQVTFLDDAEITVNKTNTAGGNAYGINTTSSAKVEFTNAESTTAVNVSNAGTGITYGAYTTAANSLITFNGSTEININKTSTGGGATHGVYATSGSKIEFTNASETATFNVTNAGTGATYGVYSNANNSTLTFAGNVDITTKNINTDSASTVSDNVGIVVVNGAKVFFTNPESIVKVDVSSTGAATSSSENAGIYNINGIVTFESKQVDVDLKINARAGSVTYGIWNRAHHSAYTANLSFNNPDVILNINVTNTGIGETVGLFNWEILNPETYGPTVFTTVPGSSNIKVLTSNTANTYLNYGIWNTGTVNLNDLVLEVKNDGLGTTCGILEYGILSYFYIDGSAYLNVVATNAASTKSLYGVYVTETAELTFSGDTTINITKAGAANAYSLASVLEGVLIINESGTNTTKINGNMIAETGGSITINFTNPDSYLVGLMNTDGDSTIDMGLSNLAVWKPTGSVNSVNNANLTVANGIIDLSWWELSKLPARAPFDVAFRDITLSDLAIDGVSTLIINSDVKGNQADRFIVENLHDGGTATATQYLQVAYDKAVENYAAEAIKGSIGGYYLLKGDDLIEVFTVNNNEDGIDILFEGLESTIDGVLTQFKVMPDVYDETTGDGVFHGYLGGLFVAPTEDPSETVKTFSDNVASLHWMTRLANDNFVSRLGDLRRFDNDNLLGVWAKLSSGTLNTTNETFNRDIRDDYFIAQAGFDKVFIKEDSKIYAGLMLQYFEDDSRYVNGEGNVDSISFGGYGSWLGKNSYVDVTVKAGNVKSDYKLVNSNDDRISGEYDAWGIMLNGEYGVYFPVNADINILPSVQLTYNTYEDLKHTTSNGISVNSYDNDSLILRVGTDLNCEFEDGNLYFGANVYHNFMKSPTTTMSYQGVDMDVKSEISNTWFKFALGGNIKTTEDTNLYMELSTLIDGGFNGNCDINENWQASIGVRCSF